MVDTNSIAGIVAASRQKSVNTNTAAGIAQASKAVQAPKTTDWNAAAQSAVLKLTSGKDLTSIERTLINAPLPTTTKPKNPGGTTSPVVTTSGTLSKVDPEPNNLNDGSGGNGGSSSSGSSSSTTTGNASTAIKVATSNLFVFDDAALASESLVNLIFEELGGIELLDITRTDLAYDIQTQTAPNQPISNLSSLVNRYSPKSIVGLQGTADRYFETFALDINRYTPKVSTNGENNVYVSDTNDVVIEVVNIDIENNERVEIEILSYDSVYSDTI